MCADIYPLLWGDDSPPTYARPSGLNRERIVAEAIAVADAEGLEKVSMPRLAERLGSGVMSLYRYVPGKRELLALMFDTALAGAPTLPSDQDWRPCLHSWAHAVHDFFRAHPWALPLATTNHVMGPHEFAWLDRALGALARSPLTASERLVSVLAVNSFVLGGTRTAANDDDADPQWFRFLSDPRAREQFPHAAALIADGSMMDVDLINDRFEFGLQRTLDGIERYIERGQRN